MVMEIIVRANVVVSAHQTLIVGVFVVAEKIMEEIKIRIRSMKIFRMINEKRLKIKKL